MAIRVMQYVLHTAATAVVASPVGVGASAEQLPESFEVGRCCVFLGGVPSV